MAGEETSHSDGETDARMALVQSRETKFPGGKVALTLMEVQKSLLAWCGQAECVAQGEGGHGERTHRPPACRSSGSVALE